MSLKNSPVLLVRADASQAIGTGHVMRCIALAKAWQVAGGTVFWLWAEMIPALRERLDREGIACRRIGGAVGTSSDAEQLIVEARDGNSEWVAVDGYRFLPNYIRTLKRSGLRVLFLDDDGRFDSYEADVVLNQNASAKSTMYANREQTRALLLGGGYALLRPEFLMESPRRDHASIARNILVTMGGSDPANITEKVVHALLPLDIDLKLVVGGGNLRGEALLNFADRVRPRIQVEFNPENMAQVMRWADVAISAAGSTSWELAYMGLPAVMIAASSDQAGIARYLEEHGIAVNLGWHANLSEEAIRDVLTSLLRDRQRRSEISQRGRDLIDGRGAARVVKFLNQYL